MLLCIFWVPEQFNTPFNVKIVVCKGRILPLSIFLPLSFNKTIYLFCPIIFKLVVQWLYVKRKKLAIIAEDQKNLYSKWV